VEEIQVYLEVGITIYLEVETQVVKVEWAIEEAV
jgi:hypothetical protein